MKFDFGNDLMNEIFAADQAKLEMEMRNIIKENEDAANKFIEEEVERQEM